MRSNTLKIAFFRAFAIIVVPLSLLAAAEVACRLVWPEYVTGEDCSENVDGPLGWRNRANCSYVIRRFEMPRETTVRYDSCGRRNQVDCHVQAANPKLKRIATVGASFGLGAANGLAETYQARLVAILGKDAYAFDNYGVAGYDLLQNEEVLSGLWRGNYDVVVLIVLPNDFHGDVSARERERRRTSGMNAAGAPQVPQNDIKQLVRQSRLFTVLSHFLFAASDRIYLRLVNATGRDSYIGDPISSEWRDKAGQFEGFLGRLDPEIVSKLVVVSIPQRPQLIAARVGVPGAGTFPDALKQAVVKRGIAYIDALPAFAAANEELFLPVDGHLNDRGAFLLGELIANRMPVR